MKRERLTLLRSLLSIAITGVSVLPGTYTLAEIIPDASFQNASNIETTHNLNIIQGGTQVGNNLFHSFSQLSIPKGNITYLNNALDIQNIFTRVTGTNISNIEGLIRTNGEANLFLINPNGIIFGSDSLLDVNGSFAATTASNLRFSDGTEFNTTNPQLPPTSIIDTGGLQYGKSQTGATITSIGNLRFGKDLTFVADNIDIQGQLQVGGVLRLSAQNKIQVNNQVTASYTNIDTNSLTIQNGTSVSNTYSRQGALPPIKNGGIITLNTDKLIVRDSGSISIVTGGSLSLNPVNLIPIVRGNSSSVTLDSNNLNSTAGGNISINVSFLPVRIKPVPEPNLTFSMLVSAAVYSAWKFKRKQ